MSNGFRTAQRQKSYLKMGIIGVSGSGKTYSALKMARGMVDSWDKVGIIDTENGSADLYADFGDYQVMTIEPPFSPDKYINAIYLAEQAGLEVLIIDSLSHAWSAEGGILDQHGKATSASKYKGNSWAAWREVTPKHDALVNSLLQSKLHIIVTMRAKTEYVQNTEDGKTTIEKVGLAPVQRDGLEYEFTVVLDLSLDHTASTSKDRTGLFDGRYFTPDIDTGELIKDWFNGGTGEPINKGTENIKNKLDEEIAKPELVKTLTEEYKNSDNVAKQKAMLGLIKELGVKKFEDASLENLKKLKEFWDNYEG